MPSYSDPDARRAYMRELMRKRRAAAKAVSSSAVSSPVVSSKPVSSKPVSSTPVSSLPVNSPAVSSPDKARARKLQARAKNPAETPAAREGFRLRFDELASRLGLSSQALSAAL